MDARPYDIVIQSETPGASTTMFRIVIADKVIAEQLTAVQAHILIGDILERWVNPAGVAGVKLSVVRTNKEQH